MNHKYTRFLLFSLLWVNSVGLLFAQVSAPKPPPQLVTFFMVGGQELMGEFSKPDKPASFKFRTAKGVKEVTLLPGTPSQTFSRIAGSMITLFKEKPSGEPGKPLEVVTLTETAVPATWRNVLVLLHLDEASNQLTLKPINQSYEALPSASVSFYNLTRLPMAIKMGESQGIVPAQSNLVLPLGLKGDEPTMVDIQVAAEIDGTAQLLSRSAYALTSKDRRTILLAPGQTSRLRMSILAPAPPDPVETTGIAMPSVNAK